MSEAEDLARLREQGHRLTPQRLTVLEVVRQSGRHLTAEEIHGAVVEQHPFVNLATVYRALQWLEDVQLVAPIMVSGAPLRYEYMGAGAHHHLICLECGREEQIGDDILDSLKTSLMERYQFAAHLHHLGLPGRCAACRQATNEGNVPTQE